MKKITIFIVAFSFIISIFATGCANKTTTQAHRLQWWLTDVNWDKNRSSLSGNGVTIAILDTGIDFTHNDLAHVEHEEFSVVQESKKNTEHGTAIAGIIAGSPYNEKGVLGIAPNVKLLSIDVTNSETVSEEDLIKGIQLAIDHNADIINISIGVKKGSEKLHNAIQAAYQKGVIIVASAGNYMKDEVLYPACYDEVIAVGGYNRSGMIISPKGDVEHVIYLPGDNVVTTVPQQGYAGVQGTSFSTAIMTATMVLAKEKYADMDNKRAIKATGKLITLQTTEKLTVDKILRALEEKA